MSVATGQMCSLWRVLVQWGNRRSVPGGRSLFISSRPLRPQAWIGSSMSSPSPPRSGGCPWRSSPPERVRPPLGHVGTVDALNAGSTAAGPLRPGRASRGVVGESIVRRRSWRLDLTSGRLQATEPGREPGEAGERDGRCYSSSSDMYTGSLRTRRLRTDFGNDLASSTYYWRSLQGAARKGARTKGHLCQK
jgi:hypothetical protein